ncbi:MAG: DUF167 domain-containing protein [Polyangiaceae bacterium]|nr:DUF167 domain-containing protein [Polyangiaceae bacterium]MCW5790077.1 DUF167 domain-containing protein [Polyangiaceae bacterium]
MHRLELQEQPDAVALRVFAKPRASRSRVLGVREGALEVALAAPPVDGAANQELVATLARALGVPRRQVELVRGDTSKHKLVRVQGLGVGELRERLAGATK